VVVGDTVMMTAVKEEQDVQWRMYRLSRTSLSGTSKWSKENHGGGNIEPHVTLIVNAASGCANVRARASAINWIVRYTVHLVYFRLLTTIHPQIPTSTTPSRLSLYLDIVWAPRIDSCYPSRLSYTLIAPCLVVALLEVNELAVRLIQYGASTHSFQRIASGQLQTCHFSESC